MELFINICLTLLLCILPEYGEFEIYKQYLIQPVVNKSSTFKLNNYIYQKIIDVKKKPLFINCSSD